MVVCLEAYASIRGSATVQSEANLTTLDHISAHGHDQFALELVRDSAEL